MNNSTIYESWSPPDLSTHSKDQNITKKIVWLSILNVGVCVLSVYLLFVLSFTSDSLGMAEGCVQKHIGTYLE